MELKRFKDIIAIKTSSTVLSLDSIVAFHSNNLEVAEISEEVFNEMSPISTSTANIPQLIETLMSSTAKSDLEVWNAETASPIKQNTKPNKINNITLNINQICNLKCSYCAAGGDGTYGAPSNKISIEKTVPQLDFFISKLKPNDSFSVSFVGGEPLLHPEAIEAIYQYLEAKSDEMKISHSIKVVTNGTLLNKQNIEILRRMSLHLTISIDGNKENNDFVRPSKDGKSTTDKIIDGLALLAQNRGKIKSINFSSIFSEKNTNLVDNYTFLKSLAPDSLDFVFENNIISQELLHKFNADLSQIAQIAWEAGGEPELRKIRSFDHYFNLLDQQQKVENHCGAGKTYLMIDSKNKLFSCVWDTNTPDASIGDNTTLNTEKLSNYSKPLIELNNCNTCWARYLCGGGCMYINKSHTGNKHKKSDTFCERIRHLILLSILYYKQARDASHRLENIKDLI